MKGFVGKIGNSSETATIESAKGRVFDSIEVLESPSDADLASLLQVLKPGGKVSFATPLDEGRLVLAGFVETSDRGGQRPDWEEGAAQTLGKKADKKWKLDDDDLVEEEFRPFNAWKSESVVADDLIDEDDLLKDIAQVEPGSLLLPAVGEGECGPAKKACKNCVCGRAEQEAAGASQSKKLSFAESGALEVDANGRSVIDTARLKAAAGGCGSCSLGDAFRCAGCPSKGLPAYSVGDKIVIDLE